MEPPTDPTLADLAALQQAVEQARLSLNHLRTITAQDAALSDNSMRTRTACPSCACCRLIHATEVLDRAETFVRSPMALHQPSAWRFSGKGLFQAWICTRCGLVEWYVPTTDQVPLDGLGRRRVTGPGGSAAEELPPENLPTDPDDRVEGLALAEAALRRATAELLQQRLSCAGVLDRSMRHRLCCPLCQCVELLHARAVLDRADGPTRGVMSLDQRRWYDTEGVGQLEAWICTACGVVEWYVPDLSGIEADGKRWRMLESDALLLRVERALPAPRPVPPVAAGSPPEAIGRAVAAMTENIATLRQRLSELLTLATSTPPPLRRLQACPACGERHVLHVTEILDRSESGRSRMTLIQPQLFVMAGKGPMEAWICTACGLVEWAITDLSGVEPDGQKLRLVQGEERPGSPYR